MTIPGISYRKASPRTRKMVQHAAVKPRGRRRSLSQLLKAISLILAAVFLVLISQVHMRMTMVDKDQCLRKLKNIDILTNAELSKFGSDLCNPSNAKLLDLVIGDRERIRRLERRSFLSQIRSYRLSGLVCNMHLDQSVPPVASEAAFKCLPREYRQKACMGGLVRSPESCGSFRPDGMDANKQLERQGPYDPLQLQHHIDCDDPNTNCSISKSKGSSISDGQLPDGMADAEVLHIRSDGRPIWKTPALDYISAMLKQDQDISPAHYPGAHAALERAMKVASVRGKSVLVMGSISPWVEALAIHLGAQRPTLTVDYNPAISTDRRLKVRDFSDMLEDSSTHPLVVSYSSIEHDGQGRYNDPLDPDGDLAAMKETWLKVAPGGLFLLGVPFGSDDYFHWYSQRTYSKARLPLLAKGWEYNGLATKNRLYNASETFHIENVRKESPVLILRKPKEAALHIEDENGSRSWLNPITMLAADDISLKCTYLGSCGRNV